MTTSPADLLERLERLEAKVDMLDSVREIELLQQRYLRCLADRAWDDLAEIYAEDAVCDVRLHGRLEGREAIQAMLHADLGPVVRSKDAYILSSPSVTVDGDTAYGEFIWHRMVCEFRTAFGMMRVWGPWTEGVYKVHYVRIDGRWLIRDLWSRVIRPDHDDDIADLPEGAVIGALDPTRR